MIDSDAVRAEIKAANLEDTVSQEILVVDGKRSVIRPDGSTFCLEDLTDAAYWLYLSMREHSWYE